MINIEPIVFIIEILVGGNFKRDRRKTKHLQEAVRRALSEVHGIDRASLRNAIKVTSIKIDTAVGKSVNKEAKSEITRNLLIEASKTSGFLERVIRDHFVAAMAETYVSERVFSIISELVLDIVNVGVVSYTNSKIILAINIDLPRLHDITQQYLKGGNDKGHSLFSIYEYGISKDSYDILPRFSNYLVFVGTKKFSGQKIKSPYVTKTRSNMHNFGLGYQAFLHGTQEGLDTVVKAEILKMVRGGLGNV